MSDGHIQKLKGADSHKKGCVTKHELGFKDDRCSYRYNGYQEARTGTSLKGRNKRKLYEVDFTREKDAARLPRVYREYKIGQKKTAANLLARENPKEKRDAWWFKGENFKNAFTPYNHNHHHILPWASLKSLSEMELDLLQEGEYNLNDGDNMILLPCLFAFGVALKLPDHPHAHRTYNKDVKTIINKVKRAVSEGTEDHGITEENAGNFAQQLVDWQKRQFDKIVDHGEKVAEDFEKGIILPRNQINKCPMADPSG